MRKVISWQFFKTMVLLGLAALVVSGCATRSTVETRKKERYGVYSQLTPEMRSLVDQSQIKVGMPMDAVYIAWGKPSQITTSETPQGRLVTWLYINSYLQEYTYWGGRGYYGRRYYYGGPILQHDYYPQDYVSAEVTFKDGVVEQWRTLPHPR